MPAQALLFGSIGTLAETHDMQRRAFNAAFADAGLDWHWEGEAYRDMLRTSGGKARIASYAGARGETVDAGALHAAKVRHFGRIMADEGLTLRPGVRDLIDDFKSRGLPVAFVTGTGRDQSTAMLDNLGDALRADEFALVTDVTSVDAPKPAADIWQVALTALQVAPQDALAIEDTPICAQSLVAAGIPTVGFPGEAARGQAFPEGVRVVEALSPEILDQDGRAA